ncbi:MAG: LacI family DNA-binding transcriptional regulator [Burkholderiaceae bacterium]|nr:LacI family DNA-binding transcriptional regulator [Burkholderiaceae bacterium]MCD8517054.1 LacI family DNA-binding transcriptional regulator [Burkholderiaceae bacterium]MCD8536898.1 LacI family DNA-binding transcriptional regulator [Burkholderiaceae bacterium]MCD8566075.1 LacI family DNA-binding transcriptional regulator [Burkholderiaceae bacterium]
MSKPIKKSSIVTLEDVALAVGMSISTVSRTFTPGASVGKHAKAKILRAAAELGYRPNAIARTLSTRQSRIIALVVSYLHNQFYPLVIEQISKLLQHDGFHVLLFVNEEGANHETQTDDLLLQILSYQVDGIILASSPISSKLAKQCVDNNTPVVMFNRISKLQGVGTVESDNYAGGQLAAQALLRSGAKRMGFIAGLETASTSIERQRGFVDALKAAGHSLFAQAVGHYDQHKVAAAARQMFSEKANMPDAVFIANDHMAFAVLDVLRNELGLSVPRDVQVIGFDNVPQAAWGAYELTTIEQNAEQMSQATVSMLLAQIHAKEQLKPLHVVIPTRLIHRKTTRNS